MSLNDVLCQDKVVDVFQHAMKHDRLGHAYIFAGEDGVGRYLMAKEWAKALLCEGRDSLQSDFVDSCKCCRSCQLFDSDSHPDFKHIYKELSEFLSDSAKRKKNPSEFSIHVIREFLVDIVASKPQMAKKCVYVISEAEKMNAAAQNAMLKTLEEPPAYCLIILLCTRTDKLLPTILSRSQVLRFGPVDEAIIINKLSEEGIDGVQAKFWARFTSGSLGQSIMYSKMASLCDCYSIKCQLVEKLANARLADSLDIAEWMVAKNGEISEAFSDQMENVSKSDLKRRAQKIMLKMLLVMVTDMIRLSVDGSEDIVNSGQTAQIQQLCTQVDVNTAAKFVEKINSSMRWVDAYVNEKLIFEEILLHFTKLKN
ncbi:MAG: ATP-binding protein [Sedimentisphaeraceae bacterium JB056]